ncbi:MAG: ABC transporter substrate-binding protein [Treponema sp.]|nr:ABC transporter substrate-binding protein [Treponema sp.]
MKKNIVAAVHFFWTAPLFVCSLFAFGVKDNGIQNTRTVVDQIGDTVVLPQNVERVVIASVWPLASVYCLAFGTDSIVGLDPAIISAAENSMLIKKYPDLSNKPSSFSKNGVLNVEELIALKPDVVLYSSGIMADRDAARTAGIPAVGFSLDVKDFNAVETINSWVSLLGEVMGKDIRDNNYIAYGNKIQELVASRVKNIPENEKPLCMFIHRYTETGVGIPGLKTWADYWITASGGRNAAASVSGTPTVTMEQIYQWNPQKIYITNFNDALPYDLYNSTFHAFDFSTVDAIKNKAVCKVPLGMYRWYVTCSDSPMMLLWMAKQNQPEVFADIDLNAYMREFYQTFYGMNLSDAELNMIYNPVREASGGIKNK